MDNFPASKRTEENTLLLYGYQFHPIKGYINLIKMFNKIVEDQKKTTPLKRAGTPDDIANSVIFFCLEGGEHITGETLIADAGMHLSLPK